MNGRQYLIFDSNSMNEIDFTQVLETSISSMRLSLDGTKTCIKWERNPPTFIGRLTGKQGPYSFDQMYDLMQTSFWKSDSI